MREKRRNPLYAWQMLEFLAFSAGTGTRSDPLATTEVPNWVLWYLQDVAEALCTMARGHRLESGAERRLTAAAGTETITPAEALAEVPRVLGLAHQGWNAFAAYHRDDLRDSALLRLELGGEEREELQRFLKLKHSRSLRRALSRARGGVKA
jgi:hypothetical protein